MPFSTLVIFTANLSSELWYPPHQYHKRQTDGFKNRQCVVSKKSTKVEAKQSTADLIDQSEGNKSAESGKSVQSPQPEVVAEGVEAVDQLNRETGVLAWQELLRFFARGVVIKVHQDLDLVEVGRSMSADDTAAMQSWLDASLVSRASDDDARDWTERQPEFWCLVAAPWVLVQERDLARETSPEGATVH